MEKGLRDVEDMVSRPYLSNWISRERERENGEEVLFEEVVALNFLNHQISIHRGKEADTLQAGQIKRNLPPDPCSHCPPLPHLSKCFLLLYQALSDHPPVLTQPDLQFK